MNFVLIDYKGGAAFQALRALPHTVGMVTDLDEFEVERALASLRAELQRRKVILEPGGQDRYSAVLGRAARAAQGATRCRAWSSWSTSSRSWPNSCPSSSASLVNIGRQGRSLGIHLVLATQRPSGVVTADLRGQHQPPHRAAGRLTRGQPGRHRDRRRGPDPGRESAGRAYAWLGGGRPAAFQSALVTARRPDPANPSDRWRPRRRAIQAAQPGAEGAEQAPLPPARSYDTLWSGRRCGTRFAWARYPGCSPAAAGSRRWPLVSWVSSASPTSLPGSKRSRPSSTSREQVTCWWPGRRNRAGPPCSAPWPVPDRPGTPGRCAPVRLDGGGGLAALSALPHCGAVVTPAEPDRADRLLARLAGELTAGPACCPPEGSATWPNTGRPITARTASRRSCSSSSTATTRS